MELEATQGAFIEQVTKDSAAQEAGIEAGDVITKVNDKNVKSFNELRGKIGSIGAGKSVKLTVIKSSGKEKTYKIILKKADSASIEPASIHRMLDGAELSNNVDGYGVNVDSVGDDSPAQVIGLEDNDIISGVNRKRVTNIAELREYLAENKGMSLLNVIRGNTNLYIRIR
jgi:serine protease Do/serine protease DegQ